MVYVKHGDTEYQVRFSHPRLELSNHITSADPRSIKTIEKLRTKGLWPVRIGTRCRIYKVPAGTVVPEGLKGTDRANLFTEFVGEGVSYLSPADNFCRKKGRAIAFIRASMTIPEDDRAKFRAAYASLDHRIIHLDEFHVMRRSRKTSGGAMNLLLYSDEPMPLEVVEEPAVPATQVG